MQSTGGARRKRLKATSAAVAAETPENRDGSDEIADADDEPERDSRGLTQPVRRALSLINPLMDGTGKRKSSASVPQGARPPLSTFAISTRVRLTEKIAFYSNLIPSSTGTVVGFAYSTDAMLGPALPGADLEEALNSPEQPQLPLVLVQFDKYAGPSCHPILPRVVPIYATTSIIVYNGEKYSREQVPLEPANATTVHQAQGSSTEEHVMCPPGSPHADFARSLFYVALSRCELLSGLHIIMHKVTREMFTKHKKHIDEINAEYERLRQLPKWRDLINED